MGYCYETIGVHRPGISYVADQLTNVPVGLTPNLTEVATVDIALCVGMSVTAAEVSDLQCAELDVCTNEIGTVALILDIEDFRNS